ncbi:MAG TPA: hypothetical protein PKI71_01630 [Candidatus Rifleibacterium sp.]|nr:hypothetical protein [Candidatus Rifleibacterium sp.]
MANQFYTPSPMVNFRYESNPSDAQRLVDTMKEIKQEGQADELHEAKLKDLRQAYELSALKMQKAQMQLTEEQRKIALDQGAAEVYRTFMAGGGSRADAIRAANNYIAINGTWQDRQEADAEYIKMASDLAKVVTDTPELAGELADLLNSRSDTPIDPQVLRQRIMQRQATPLPGAPGYMIGMLEDGSIGIIDKRTEGMKKAEEFDQRIKQETLDIKKEREANQREIARMRNEASMSTKAQAEISKIEKQRRNEALKVYNSNQNKLDSLRRSASMDNPNRMNILMQLIPGLKPDATPEETTAKVQGLITELTIRRDMAFQQLSEIDPELAALQAANFTPTEGLTTLPAPAAPAAPPVAAPATPNTSTEKKVSPAFEAYLKRREQRKAKR